jgi:hypothetical protein
VNDRGEALAALDLDGHGLGHVQRTKEERVDGETEK